MLALSPESNTHDFAIATKRVLRIPFAQLAGYFSDVVLAPVDGAATMVGGIDSR